jgi:hypothetical protein
MRRITKRLNLESFTSGNLKFVLFGQPEGLESICFLLNSTEPPELCSELRRLIEIWQKSGPNLSRMLKDDDVLAARARHGRTLLVPTNTGKGHLHWRPYPQDFDAGSWKDQALTHFMDLIVNPEWHKLGGPCQRCDRFYVKKTSRQKKYCSRRCGSRTTAVAATRKMREEERARKLRRAQEAANRWVKVHTRDSWKDWVSTRTKLTVKWLTRAVNRGDFQAPKKDRNVPSC